MIETTRMLFEYHLAKAGCSAVDPDEQMASLKRALDIIETECKKLEEVKFRLRNPTNAEIDKPDKRMCK